MFASLLVLWWGFYYQSSGWYNDYGSQKSELFLLLDGLLVLPFLCFICIADKREALIKSLAYICLMILLGSVVIPESEKSIWLRLESLRYVLVLGFILFEFLVIVSVLWLIRLSLRDGDNLDEAIQRGIDKHFKGDKPGDGLIANVMAFDLRLWSYFLLPARHLESRGPGQHFTYHQLDGNQANLLGFILLTLFELPLTHLLLHFLWSPLAANIFSVLTLLGMVFLVSEYRACSRRPVSVSNSGITIRYGLRGPRFISWPEIEAVNAHQGFIKRQNAALRYRLFANPNVKLTLSLASSGKFHSVYLGLDSPSEFIELCQLHLKERN